MRRWNCDNRKPSHATVRPRELKFAARRTGVWMALALFSAGSARSAPIVVSVLPTDDDFVRALAPAINYGMAGGLSVSGTQAVNGAGQAQGRSETLLRFDLGEAVQSIDDLFGAGLWEVTRVELVLTENGMPNNPIFNRGIGHFDVRWFDVDDWTEGPGGPNNPVMGVGNQATFNWVVAHIDPTAEVSLGMFANAGESSTRPYVVGLKPAFIIDLMAGRPVSLHVTPIDPTIGFTFQSVNFPADTSRPLLRITAEAGCDPDGIEDLHDFVLLASCLSGSGNPGDSDCECSDYDADGDVDLLDFQMLQMACEPR